MSKNILFYIAGGLLSLLLIIYIVTRLNDLVIQMSVISQSGSPPAPQVESFNLEKFRQLKIAK